jgi:hypothetical protein
MDLEALPPEDPTPGGEHTEAPRPAWEPAPWQPAWGTDPTAGPSWTPGGDETPPPKRLGFSRTTKIVSGAVALALVTGGAWAAGTALHGGSSTVRFQPAAATATAASGGTGGSTGGSGTPHPRTGMRGVAGQIGTVNAPSFNVNALVPPPRPATPPTPGAAPVAPPAPTTKSVTVKTNAQTTFISVTQGKATDLTAGMEIVAVGQVTNGTLTATHAAATDAGLIPTRKPPTGSAPPNAPKPPTGAAPATPPANHPGVAFGTIASIASNQPASGEVTLHLTTNNNRGASTVVIDANTAITIAQKGSIDTVKTGDMAVVTGTHNLDGSITATRVITVSADLKNAAGGVGRFGGLGFGPALGGLGGWLRLGGPGGFPGFFGGQGGFGRFGFGHRGGAPGSGSGSSGSSGKSGTNGSSGTKSGTGVI